MGSERDVRSAQNGNKDAFIRLIKENETSMYRIARAILKSDTQCADAIQETILKIYKYIGTLKEPRYFKTWITRILINECNAILKFESKVVPLEAAYGIESNKKDYERLEIINAIDSLEDELRVLVTLYYFEDLQIKEIADTLNIPEGTIKSRLHRARVKLAQSLEIQLERSSANE